MDRARHRTARMLIWVIGLVGILPLVLMAPAAWDDLAALDPRDFRVLEPWASIVFAILFACGAGLAVYAGARAEALMLLPVLALALMPGLLGMSRDHGAARDAALARQIAPAWEPAPENLRQLMENVLASWRDGTPFELQPHVAYEYAMSRNSGFRILTFSSWNGGVRAVTDEYMRGDRASNFALGHSAWLLGTPDTRDACPGANDVFHIYLGSASSFKETGSNGCNAERQIYRRARSFASAPPEVPQAEPAESVQE